MSRLGRFVDDMGAGAGIQVNETFMMPSLTRSIQPRPIFVFSFRRLTAPCDQRRFLEQYAVHSGDAIGQEALEALAHGYLSAVEVVACVDAQQSIVGGYVVAPAHSSRWRLRLPQAELPRLASVLEFGLELNLVWLKPSLRKTRAAAALWRQIARDLGRRRNRAITYAVRTDKRGLLLLYETVSTEVLYEGPFKDLPGTYRLYRSTPLRFRLIPLSYFFRLLLRDLALAKASFFRVRDRRHR